MRTAAYRTVLGHDGPARPIAFAPGALRYLPRLGAVVAREYRLPGGWRCAVIARRGPRLGGGPPPGHIEVSDAELAGAEITVLVDPTHDPEAAAMLWLVRVWQQWPGRRCYTVAGQLLDLAREPGELRLILVPGTVRRLMHATRVPPPLLRRIVARLTAEGFLTPSAVGGYTLSLPYEPA